MSFLSAGVLGVGEALEGAARAQRKVSSDAARHNSERKYFSGMGAARNVHTGVVRPGRPPVKTSKSITSASNWGHIAGRAKTISSRIHGLGASPNITQGSRAWWNWYATQYLPKYYTPGQVQQYVVSSPYYTQYGSPYGIGVGIGINPGQYVPNQPRTYYPPPQTYYPPAQYPQQQYPYSYNQYGYGYDPYYQAQYTQGISQQGAYACQQQGGYWDYAQQSCNGGGYGYGSQYPAQQGSSPPNVVGMTEEQAISVLNAAGFNVWELSRDGISQGVPPGYSANRVNLSVANGVVNAAAIG